MKIYSINKNGNEILSNLDKHGLKSVKALLLNLELGDFLEVYVEEIPKEEYESYPDASMDEL